MALSYSSRILASSLVMGCLILAARADPLRAQPGVGGAMGPVSRASIGISLSVAPRVEADRHAAVHAAGLSDRTVWSEPFCIWSNTSIGTFSLSASAVSEQGSVSAGQPAPTFPYDIQWSGDAGRSSALDHDRGLAGLRASSLASCGSGTRLANLLVVRPTKSAGGAALQSPAVLLLIAPD